MKLVNMKKAADEEQAEMATSSPPYPWGLRLHLSDEVLEALGYDSVEAFTLGSLIDLQAKATVVGYSEQAGETDGDSYKCVDLQITDLGLGKITAGKKTPGQALYGQDDD